MTTLPGCHHHHPGHHASDTMHEDEVCDGEWEEADPITELSDGVTAEGLRDFLVNHFGDDGVEISPDKETVQVKLNGHSAEIDVSTLVSHI